MFHLSNRAISFLLPDLYVFFEAVRELGGIDLVTQNRQFSTIRDFMHLPTTYPHYASFMRNNYDLLCTPCEDYLICAVERSYCETDLHSTTHDWLRARVDFSDANLISPLPRQKSRKGANANVDSSDLEHEEDFMRHPEATQAAIRARMRVDTLEPAEANHCLFSGNESYLVHVDIRNHILRMWYRQTRRRLDVYTSLMDVPDRFHELGCRVFSYLECTGAINFGAIPLVSPVSIRRGQRGEKLERVAVVGAGISGLIAARQLRSFGVGVTVLEARSRPGGRIRTEKGMFSTGVDMGAMLITGVLQNPVAVLANQTNSPLHFLDTECPLFDIDGTWVSKETDSWAEKEYNTILDATARYRKREHATQKARLMSLGEAFQKALRKRVARRKERIQAYKNSSMRESSLKRSSLRENPLRESSLGESPLGESSEQTAEDSFLEGVAGYDIIEVSPMRNRREPLLSKSASTENRFSSNSTVYSSAEYPSRSSRDNRKRSRGYFSTGAFSAERSCRDVGNTGRNKTKKKSSKKSKDKAKSQEESEESVPKVGTSMDDRQISRLLRWHIANLEYACAADINKVSLLHWDQDDPYGFEGEHVLLKSGYEPVLSGLVNGLEKNLQYSTEVVAVYYSKDWNVVEITTKSRSGEYSKHTYDAVLITVPLGVLKQESILFKPPLPSPKKEAISRLGTGGLMKVAMEFTHQFWVENDMFGALRESAEKRGEFYFFWNLVPCTGKLILVSLVAEPSASEMEKCPDEEVVDQAMMVLRRCYPEAPDPIAYAVSRWSTDRFSKGAYTNIPVGSCGDDYDTLAAPVERVFFAGEHTCGMNPTTCASGLISGLREACRIIEYLDIIPSIAKIHSDVLGDLMSTRNEKHTVDENGDTSCESQEKRTKLSVEPITPQSPSPSL